MLFVGIGGAFGALVRFQLGRILARNSTLVFPIGTFLINLSGAVLLGVLSASGLGDRFYLLFGQGFLGAYTTFSTFMYEGVQLFHKKAPWNAVIYIVGSLLLGIIGYMIGFQIASLA